MHARVSPLKTLFSAILLATIPMTGFADDVVEVDTVASTNFKAVEAEKQERLALWSQLQNERAKQAAYGEIFVVLNDAEKSLLYGETQGDDTQHELIGIEVPIHRQVDMAPEARYYKGYDALGAIDSTADGGFVWTTSIEAEDATAIRVQFTNLDLPKGAELYLYNDEGQAHGPYTGKGPHDSGKFWSHTVFGEVAWVQLYAPATEFDQARFEIAAISHLGSEFEIAERTSTFGKADCSINIDCIENAECYGLDSILSSARKAVAKITFQVPGGTARCSGGLLNDQDSSGRTPWFLTANHCLNTEEEADTLEAFFQYKSPCGSCSGSYVDSVLGADVWAHSSTTDFTLLELSELPSSWSLLGWTNATVYDDPGTQLYRISHPRGSPQSFTQNEVLNVGNSKYVVSDPVVGAVEDGSSGAPLFRSDSKVVGQLKGHTHGNNYDMCDPTTFNTRDGALSYYWKSVKPYLASPSSNNKMHISAVAAETRTLDLGFLKYYFARATVTVVDRLGNVVPRATVTVTFSGGPSGTLSGVTGDDGTVTMQYPAPQFSPPSFTACVSNVTQQYFTNYDSGANTVTCDSN